MSVTLGSQDFCAMIPLVQLIVLPACPDLKDQLDTLHQVMQVVMVLFIFEDSTELVNSYYGNENYSCSNVKLICRVWHG